MRRKKPSHYVSQTDIRICGVCTVHCRSVLNKRTAGLECLRRAGLAIVLFSLQFTAAMKIVLYLVVSGISGLSGLVITKTVFNPLEQLEREEEVDFMDKWAAQSVEALFEPVKQAGKFELGIKHS